MQVNKTKSYKNHALHIQVSEDDDSIVMIWTGKSIIRKPSDFIMPILIDILNRSLGSRKKIVMDFRSLEYMNSSTFTPVIKVLERARTGTHSIYVLYKRSQRWQELSFAALKVFETQEGRVRIVGTD